MINVSADIRNLGIENGTAEPVTLEIKPDGGSETVNSTAEVELDSIEAATASWSINESEWPKGDYEFVVRTSDDEHDGSFEIENGGAFEISEDLGIPEENQLNGTDGQVITAESNVIIEANISNTFATEQTQNITLDVLDGDGQTVDSAEKLLTIEGSETEQVELTAGSLEPGEIYEYNISTENDDLDERGSFLVVDEPAELSVESISVAGGSVKPGSTLTLEADVLNRGADGTQYLWIEGFNGDIVDVKEIELDSGESTTTTLEWGNVAVPDPVDETTVAVRTSSDERTADVDVDPLLLLNDVTVLDGPTEPGRSIAIEADVESVAGDASQNVVLEGFDGDQVDSQEVTVSDGETETVSLEYRTDWTAITDRVTVRTDDDEIDEVAVIDRDGPICSEVSYAGSGTSEDPYEVSTVDQLQCIDEHDLDADYELVDDIDAQGTEYWNGGAGFEPIGEQRSWGEEFSGDFDGNGHAIEGLHIDRPNEDFVGLFAANSHFHSGNEYGVGDGSKIHNLRLENVSIHGQQVTGGLIGAAGGVIEDVRVSGTVEAEYQEVGGIAGSSHNADLDNRLVSEATVRGGVPAAATDEVDHPWGSNNMGIGGIVGSTGYNTEISTAYSLADVEGPFGVGGIVGWTSDFASENEQMYWAEGSITVTANQNEIDSYLNEMGRSPHDDDTGGAIFGRGDDQGDEFKDSVYYNRDSHEFAFGEHVIGDEISVNERTTDEMQGLEVTESGNLANLDYEEDGGPWVAIPDNYPRFAWELAAEGAFDVTIDDVENVTAGEAATVEVTVTSRYENREESDVEQTIALENPDGQTVDTETVTLSSTLGENDAETIELVWQTDAEDNGTAEISVRSEDGEDSATIDIEPAEHGPGASDGPGLGPAPGHGNVGDGSEYDLGPGGSNSSESDVPGIDSDIDINVDVVEIN
ncbi:hypothetical protein [Natronorubrum sp. DTA7]|uniref:hypothetical protein n=1 Tax=Natronorubrum sp. DTA7 TaxID=3447016 RepID=UPI003F869D0F